MNDGQDLIFRFALQPGTTKTQDGKTYVLNDNHRWTLPKEKDSPGQQSLFDDSQAQAQGEDLTFDFKIDLSDVSGDGKNFNKQKLVRDKALAEAYDKARDMPGEAGRLARDKVVSAQVEMIFDDIENLAAGRVPPGYMPEQFMKFRLFNGLAIELSGDPSTWANSTANLDQLDGLPPQFINGFKERRKRREQGIVRRMAVAANNLQTLVDPTKKTNTLNPWAVEGLDVIRFQPRDGLLTQGANGYYSAAVARIGIVIQNCYNDMFQPGKSGEQVFSELNDFFSNVSPEGVMLHELAHAMNCDNLYKADVEGFASRKEVTGFWTEWDKTFMSRPFQNNLKKMVGDESVEKFTERLGIAFPAIQKEWEEWAYRVNGDFVEYWMGQIERESADVSEYAQTCPAELVAEMFSSTKPMNEFSETLQTYYKLVGGPDFKLSNHKRSSSNAA